MSRGLLYNDRTSWVTRASCAPDLPPEREYDTNTAHKSDMAREVRVRGRPYSIVRSEAPRWGKSTLQMTDSSNDNEAAQRVKSLSRAVSDSGLSYANMRSKTDRWDISNHTLLRLGTAFRRPDHQDHHLLPRTQVVEQLFSMNKNSAPDHMKSIEFDMKKRKGFMRNVFESTDVRNQEAPRECGAHLGPGAYDPPHPKDIKAEGGAGKSAAKRPKRITKADVAAAAAGVAKTSKDPGSYLVAGGTEPHLGPGRYFRTAWAEEGFRKTQLQREPQIPFSTAPRFRDAPASESYKRNGANTNPRRSLTDWILPYNPIYRKGPADRTPYDKRTDNGGDYMPMLDTLNKMSLATKSRTGIVGFAGVFKSKNPRLAEPGSVLAASRREFVPATAGDRLGPGAYDAREPPSDPPPPFRSGEQRGDVRVWSDGFAGLRPRHLLKAQGHTALLETSHMDLKAHEKPPPKFKRVREAHKRRKRHPAVPRTPRELREDIYGPPKTRKGKAIAQRKLAEERARREAYEAQLREFAEDRASAEKRDAKDPLYSTVPGFAFSSYASSQGMLGEGMFGAPVLEGDADTSKSR